MLKESTYNASDTNIFCISLYSRNQTAYSANDHVNLHSCLWCLYQLIHNFLICQRIHLKTNIRRLSALCKLNLTINHLYHTILQTIWCCKQMLQFIWCLSHCKRLKNPCCFHSNLHIWRHEWQISVQTWGLLIVISSSYLRVIFNSVFASLCNQAKLWMYLITV